MQSSSAIDESVCGSFSFIHCSHYVTDSMTSSAYMALAYRLRYKMKHIEGQEEDNKCNIATSK